MPAGEYTVTERTDWSWKYKLDGTNGLTVTVGGTGTAEATFQNKRGDKNWMGGSDTVDNVFETIGSVQKARSAPYALPVESRSKEEEEEG